MSPSDLWRFLLIGYPFTILIETPVLLLGLSQRHSIKRRIFAGVWLTACTYPIVVLVMPLMFGGVSRTIYLAVAETFAPDAESVLFWLAYGKAEELAKRSMRQAQPPMPLATHTSFLSGQGRNASGWLRP